MAKAQAPPKKMRQKPAPKTNDLICMMVLDMSGSMSSVWGSVIEGVDQYVKDLQDAEGETLFSLTAFDTVFEHWHVAEPIESIPSLEGRYVPRGSTALFDAIANSIRETETKLKSMRRDDMKVLHVTVTDGYENSSVKYPREADGSNRELIALVKEMEATGNWTFVYLGAHATREQAAAVGSTMGYVAGNTMNYTSTPGGVQSTTSSLTGVTAARRGSSAASTSDAFADAGQTDADYIDKTKGEKLQNTSLTDHLGGK